MGKGILIEELERQTGRLKTQIARFENSTKRIYESLNVMESCFDHDIDLKNNIGDTARRFSKVHDAMDNNLRTVHRTMEKYVQDVYASNSELRKAMTEYQDQIDSGAINDTVAYKGSNNYVDGSLPKQETSSTTNANPNITLEEIARQKASQNAKNINTDNPFVNPNGGAR